MIGIQTNEQRVRMMAEALDRLGFYNEARRVEAQYSAYTRGGVVVLHLDTLEALVEIALERKDLTKGNDSG